MIYVDRLEEYLMFYEFSFYVYEKEDGKQHTLQGHFLHSAVGY